MKSKNILHKNKRRTGKKVDITNAIGELVLSFSTLEFTFKRVFSIITDIEEEISWAIITELGFSYFLNLLKNVSKVKYKDNKKILNEIIDIINKSRDVSEKRNLIIHSYWYNIPDDVKNIIHIVKPTKRLDFEVNIDSVEEINKLTKEIYFVQYDILKFIVSLAKITVDKMKLKDVTIINTYKNLKTKKYELTHKI